MTWQHLVSTLPNNSLSMLHRIHTKGRFTPFLPQGKMNLPRFYPRFYPDTFYPPERGKNGVKTGDRCHQGESGVKTG